MEMFRKYLCERENKELFTTDFGFVIYSHQDNNVLYIEDIYVLPKYRRSRIATTMANEVIKQAKKDWNVTTCVGSVALDANGKNNSVKTLHGFGMEIYNCVDNVLYFKKEI